MEVDELKPDDLEYQVIPGVEIVHVDYFEKLNVILVGTGKNDLLVVDPTLGDVVYKSKIRDEAWDMCVSGDRIILASNTKTGIRSDYNGILLLDTILQAPIQDSTLPVELELSRTEVESLLQSGSVLDFAKEPDSTEVIKQLKQGLKELENATVPLYSIKKEKWNTVKLHLPHSVLKSTFNLILTELWKKNAYLPQLSIAASIIERLNMLLPSERTDLDLPADRTQMFSEFARLNTFINWPHQDYRWAHPVKMAQAGFYHNPNTSTIEDRVMCFACNVCLVSWEPSDEPWSEHERHSPICPFVRGEHTHNVPLSLSYATAPAFSIKKTTHIGKPIIGQSTDYSLAVIGFGSGFVFVCDTLKNSKEVVQFDVSLRDIQSIEPLTMSAYSDICLKPKEAWVMDTSDSIAERKIDETLEDKLTLSAIALVGSQSFVEQNANCSAIVVGGTLSHFVVQNSGSKSWEDSAMVLVYGLIADKKTSKSKESSVTDSAKPPKNTGTKQETSQYEEDLFCTYMPDGDLLSDGSMLSDVNMAESPTTYANAYLHDSDKFHIEKGSEIKSDTAKAKSPYQADPPTIVSLTQKLILPPGLSNCIEILHIIPTPDASKLVINVKRKAANAYNDGAIILYNITQEESLLKIKTEPVQVYETMLDLPVDICYVANNDIGNFACVLKSGPVLLFSAADLSLVSMIKPSLGDVRITAISYSTGLERLCCGTNVGSIVLYNPGPDSESSGDRELPTGIEDSLKDTPDLITNQELTALSMQNLLKLTVFETVKPCFTVNAPSCWTKVIQAQKDRKHPQHLQHSDIDSNLSTLSWRLQKTKNSRKEHLFEITLPKAAHVGHFDIKFQLQQGCVSAPNIVASLYQVPKNSLLKPPSPSKSSDSVAGSQGKSKITSSEFLSSVNAEIVAGPLEFSSHIDLSAQGGNLVMSSPSLILSKTRHFYLHIKSTKSPFKHRSASEGSKIPKTSKSQTKSSTSKVSKVPSAKDDILISDLYTPLPAGEPLPPNITPTQKPGLPSFYKQETELEKRKEFGGCDWIHELSITVRQTKKTSIPNEALERKNMLESTEFIERLLNTVIFQGEEKTFAAQTLALELLVWIAAINLGGPQVGKRPYQRDFVRTIKSKLQDLVLHGIIYADRSTAHKCAKLLIVCIDIFGSVDNTHLREENGFPIEVLMELLNLLPYTISCESAGSLQWFFLLLSRVRRLEPTTACEALLNLLNIVSEELFKRNDPMHSLLKTRFGLFGTPFEPELFELELPPITKSYSHPVTYTGLGSDHGTIGQPSCGAGVSHLWGLKDVDFRDLLVGSLFSTRWTKIGSLSPKQQLHGLLEVEPLHFTCHAASDGTRIEKIDLGFNSCVTSIPLTTFEPHVNTSLPTGEGSKKTEPDKMEHMMMLHSLKKLSSTNLGGSETYYDALSDLKFLEENSNVLDVAYDMHNNMPAQQMFSQIQTNASSWKSGILSMVMQDYKPYEISQIHDPKASGGFSSYPKPPISKPKQSTQPAASGTSSFPKPSTSTNPKENDGLKLLLSPWQQMMYVPPQQAVVIDRMHSGARRFVVLDFGSPILLTDFVIPACSELVSISLDVWVNREDIDGQRLVIASDISAKSLVITDLQPPVLCRYLKLTAIGRYGMATTKCKIPIGLFYGHTAVLEDDLRGVVPGEDVPVLSDMNVHGHLSVLNYLVEDIGCRYQLACAKLKRLIDHLMKPELSSLDHISYFLPKGKERNRLGLNTPADQAILVAYQECITLQQQFNVAKNVIRRLQKSLKPYPPTRDDVDPTSFVTKVCSDKLHFLTEFLVEALLGACLSKFIRPNIALKSLQTLMTQDMCEKMFKNMCVLENGQCQLSTSTLLLRVAGFQPWWGKFLSHTLKTLFSSSNTMVFPQDRVFILMVYLGQRALLSARNSSVLESIMELLLELVSPISEMKGFIRSKVDMTLLGWVVMYMCLLIDGIYCSFSQDSSTMVKDTKEPKDATYVSPRWDFIQGEISLYKQFRSPQKGSKISNLRRQVKKQTISIKQKLEELDMMQGNFVNIAQMKSAYKNNALGSVNFPLPPSQLPKGYKVGACKHLKEALLKKPENTSKNQRIPSKIDKDESYLWPEIELNVNLSPSLCLALAKGLGALLLKMDTTCHSDVFLVVCKALARVATSCRPAIPLGAIFKREQIIELLLPAVGTDFVKQNNWSSAWVSHAVMCLMQDLIEGEKLFPNPQEESLFQSPGLIFNEESFPPLISSAVCMDDLEVNEPMDISPVPGTSGTTSNVSLESDDSECDELMEELVLTPANNPGQTFTVKVKNLTKRIAPCLTSYSTAIDSRLETGAGSTTELRLRMLAVVDAETLNQSLQSPVEIPEEYMKVLAKQTPISPKGTNFKCEISTTLLLSNCFDEIFRMMASENRSISIERVLQLWLSLNFDLQPSGGEDQSLESRPTIPLSYHSVAALMTALTRSTGVGIQEWGLGFQCLCLAASENPLNSSSGLWLNIITSKLFPEIVLKFLSGAGTNLQNSSVPAVGPNVCLHFYNFLLRLRQYSNNSSWTPFLKEILLRILSVFLSGPLLTSNFPMDAFNKFLDRVTCQDLTYESLSTVVSIVDYFATSLEQYVFYPDKITVRSNAELKGAPPSTTANGLPITNETIKLMKPQNLENLMLKLLSLVTSIVSLPFKSQPKLGEVETSLLSEIEVSSSLSEYSQSLFNHIRNFDQEPKTVADVIVQLEPIMMKILSVLANPKHQGSADVQNISTHFDISTPTSVTEGIMNLVNKLSLHTSKPSWIVKPIFNFLSKSSYQDLHCPLIVSESFVRMVLNVLSNQSNLVEFVNMDCVESVCQKLVASSRRFFSSSPTFVSILTQFIGRTDPNQLFGQKKMAHETFDLPEGIINFAPLGTISSTNYSAHPSEVLLQATPPHRRARAPVWSYHFYPEEKFLELIITLPCAVLLKEIQIVPHISTLSTNSPSALMVEISRDRSQVSTALGPPIQCGGMTTININLHQPEVAQTILLRLFKPKDSSNLGLSQIRVLGCTTFSEAALQGLYSPEPAQFMESSAQWMYILDKAISVSQGDLKRQIIETAVSTPDILESCYSMLMSPVISSIVQELDLSRLASVLFHFASLKIDVSQQLLNALLGPVQFGFSNAMVTNAHGQGSTRLSQLNTVVELIYNLCCNIPIYGSFNLTSLVKWVEDRADEAARGNIDMKGVVPAYIQAVAAALWTIAAGHKIDLSSIVTPTLLVKLLNWTRVIDPNSELKASIDHMICSVCYAKPWLFSYLMFLMDLIKPMDWAEKDKPIEDLLENWNEESVLWERVTINSLSQISPYLKSNTLMTLARASQSEQCADMLDASQFLGHLNTAIMDFWNHYTTLWMNANNQIEDSVISTSAFISILEFYQELCRVYKFKTWFGVNGSIFWLPILTLLSTLPGNLKTSFFGALGCDLESAVINFLSKCCWLHTNNQTIVAKCLCEVVVKQKVSSHKAVFLHSMSAFCRRLIIQLLLENEKVVVHIKNKTNSPFKSPVRTLDLKHKHPSMGVSGADRIFEISSHQCVFDIMKILEPFGTKLPKFNLKSNPKLNPVSKKETTSSDQKDFTLSSFQGGLTDMYNNKRPIKVASKKLKPDGFQDNKQSSVDEATPVMVFEAEEFPDIKLSPELDLATVLAAVRCERDTLLDSIVLIARAEKLQPGGLNGPSLGTKDDCGAGQTSNVEAPPPLPDVFKVQPLTSTIDVFSRLGGLALLAKNLPVVYPETLRSVGIGSKFTGNYGVVTQVESKDNPMVMDNDWVKIESADDFYDEMMDSMIASSTPVAKRNVSIAHFTSALGIPPHTMSAFGLFLGLPGFSEVLLTDRVGAQCMLRLSMGVTDDADGNDILSNPHAKALSTLPFNVLRCILDILPINSDKGMVLRRAMIGVKATHFILACLAVFTHQNCDPNLMPGIHHELVIAATKAQGGYSENKTGKSDDKSHVYWAKGTGFGTGSTVQSWDVELAMQKKKAEEENVTCLLQVLSSYINPKASQNKMEISDPSQSSDEHCLPGDVFELIRCSSLLPAIAGYLRNDSVLDMARHIPLYASVLQFLRALVSSPQLLPLLLPSETVLIDGNDVQPISVLLCKMKSIVDSYSKRLTRDTKRGIKGKPGGKTPEPELEDEGLAQLIPDIQLTATVVDTAVKDLILKRGPIDDDIKDYIRFPSVRQHKSLEERYIEIMRNLQFAFFDMIVEEETGNGIRFTVSHHYEGNIRTNWTRTTPNRLKRLAQESVTLSTSLPIAYGSTIFVRCDADRLDVMKVLITGPASTPYSNGCFEFDVYFPSDYPSAPMMINLETTGRQRIRFNPNLYTDGKVCLSILNTWHGRPEEKWNPQTGSLLPVLVAIQSLILNAEPYFNEPGYEKSRGTEQGERNSREYNAGIMIATLEWAMLDQIRNPSACFKEVIHHHFYMKRAEIVAQCQQWLQELIETCRHDKRAGKSVTGNLDPVSVFKSNLALLKKEFANMQAPLGLEDLTEVYANKTEEGAASSGGSTPVVEFPKEKETTKKTEQVLTLNALTSESTSNSNTTKTSDNEIDTVVEPF